MEVFDAFDNDSISGNHQLGYLKIFRWPDYHVHALPGQIWVLPTRNKTKLLKFVEVFLQYFHHSLIPIPNRIMKREILSNSFLFCNTIYVGNFIYIFRSSQWPRWAILWWAYMYVCILTRSYVQSINHSKCLQ